VEYLQRSKAALNQLRKQGLSGDAIRLLNLDDPTNFQQAERWIRDFAENPKLVKQFNDSIRKRMNISKALATDPNNTEFQELERQFNHAASEAARAFKHAAEESARAFNHQMQMSAEGYDISMADFVDSYETSLDRTYEDMGRIGEETALSLEELMTWATDTGIAGIEEWARQIGIVIGMADEAAGMLADYQAKLKAFNFLGDLGIPFFGQWGTPGYTNNPLDPRNPNMGEDYAPWPGNNLPGLPPVPGPSRPGSSGSGEFFNGIVPILGDLFGQVDAYVAREAEEAGPLGGLWGDNLGSGIEGGVGRHLGGVFNSLGEVNEEADITTDRFADLEDEVATLSGTIGRNQEATDKLKQKIQEGGGALADLQGELDTTKKEMDTTKGGTEDLLVVMALIPKKVTIDFVANTAPAIGAVGEMVAHISLAVSRMISGPINAGLLGAWNHVVLEMGLGKGLSVSPYTWNAKGRGGRGCFAAGGYPGDGGKYEPAGVVHRGEFVVDKERTQQYRPLLEAMQMGSVPGYASGGYVAMSNIVKKQFPWARITSDYRPGDPGWHGKGRAIDIAGALPYPNSTGVRQMLEINHWLARSFANITQLIHTQPGAYNILNGGPHTYDGPTQADHRDHNHWAMAGDLNGGSTPGATMDYLFDAIGFIQSKVNEFNKPVLGGVAGRLLGKVGPTLTGHFAQIIDGIIAANTTAPDPVADVGQISGSVQQIVQQIAAQRGWGSGPQWDSLYQLIAHESSWNPNAQNPTSTAYGLFQFLNSTWAGTGYAKSSDPKIQTLAGLKYIENRYGTPAGAWNFWQNQSPHWYGNGAIFDSAQMIGVGESGPEAVLPLNSSGAQFMAKTLRAFSQNDTTELRRGRTAQHCSPARSEMHYHHTETNTNFTGAVTVVASDPNEFARKMKEKSRLAAMNKPGRRTP
jgi:SLT domain-containing protein